MTSHKLKRLVGSVEAEEIIVAAECIDEGIVFKLAVSKLLCFTIDLTVVLGSKNLYLSPTTQRLSIDRSVRADVNFYKYQFKVGNAERIYRDPGRFNLAEPGIKPDGPSTLPLQLHLFPGKLSFSFLELETTNTNGKPLG